jgi:DNA-directed RNA polymerase specialized sigma24 family protein
MEREELWREAHREAELWLRRYGDTWTRTNRDDLAQEASIAAWHWASDGRRCERFWAAVQTITTRIRGRALRSARQRDDSFDAEMCGHTVPAEAPDRWYEIAGRREPAWRVEPWLRAAIGGLALIDRQLLLGFYEGFCCAELAERFRRSLACVKTRLHRARRRVRSEVEGLARRASNLD